MRITKLSLTNFRSFKETQSIDFAPVTLLFGPNSVGKSTVLMALFYLQQILAKGQCDPARIDALGGKFVGGFKNLVNGKDINNSIKLKLEYDKGDAIGSTYTYLTDLIGEQVDLALSSPVSDARKIAIELEVSWSKSQKTAYVSNYKIWFDNIEIAEVNSDAGLKQPMVTMLNYLHPLLLPYDHNEWLEGCFDNQETMHVELLQKVLKLKGIEYSSSNEVEVQPNFYYENEGAELTFSDYCFVSEFHEVINGSRIPHSEFNNSDYSIFLEEESSVQLHAQFSIKGVKGALPVLGQPLKSSLSLDDEKIDAIVGELLSDVLVAPLDNLLTLLNDSLCIGPLRHIPDANYQRNPYPSQADWYDGKACWDKLLTNDNERDTSINEWLIDKDKLNLGYKIVYKTENRDTRYISPAIGLDKPQDIKVLLDAIESSSTVLEKNSFIDHNTIHKSLNSFYEEERNKGSEFHSDLYIGQQINKQTTPSLWDCHNNIEISASDIGVGVSQLLPLVVATQILKKGIIACEQPELHVHPRVQVAIGDLLTQANSKANFLIETHSEHLILRLLRRVRETSDSELPKGQLPVKPEDISVVFLSNSEGGVKARRIDVTADGDFNEDWPGGFFDERDEELF